MAEQLIFGADAAGNAGWFDAGTGQFYAEQDILPAIGSETISSDEFGNAIDPGAPTGGYAPGLPGTYVNPEDIYRTSDPYFTQPNIPNVWAPSLPLPSAPYLGEGSEIPYVSPIDMITAVVGPIYTAIGNTLGRVAVRSVWDTRVPRAWLGRIVL